MIFLLFMLCIKSVHEQTIFSNFPNLIKEDFIYLHRLFEIFRNYHRFCDLKLFNSMISKENGVFSASFLFHFTSLEY